MIGVYATVLILLVAVSAVGQALVSISLGVRRGEPIAFSWLAPAVGIAALLILEGIAARLPGDAITAAFALVGATLLSLWWLQGRMTGLRDTLAVGLPVIAIALLGASIPFAIAGHVGILGAGLINDDMASHLLIAEYVRGDTGFVPSFVKGGYPTGPHAIVVALAELTGADLVNIFSGFTLALAPLTGMIALGLLGKELSRLRRVVGASLVSLTYLGASYLSSGAFKEPLQALILITFAVLLAQLFGMRTAADPERPPAPGVRPILRVVPVAALAAASVFNYSLPGLLWIGAVGALVLAARLWVVRPRPKLPPDWKRRLAPYLVGAVVLVLLATVQEWSRIADFARLQALNPERFGSDLGNLKEAISPLEALGIWPTGDYRTAAADAGGPTVAFYVLAVLALLALGAGLVDSRRRGLWALPAALAAIAAVWVLTAVFSTPYIAAKALAIAAPLVMLIAVRGVLSLRGRAVTALAVALRPARFGLEPARPAAGCRRPLDPRGGACPDPQGRRRASPCSSSAATTSSPTSSPARTRSPASSPTTTRSATRAAASRSRSGEGRSSTSTRSSRRRSTSSSGSSRRAASRARARRRGSSRWSRRATTSSGRTPERPAAARRSMRASIRAPTCIATRPRCAASSRARGPPRSGRSRR